MKGKPGLNIISNNPFSPLDGAVTSLLAVCWRLEIGQFIQTFIILSLFYLSSLQLRLSKIENSKTGNKNSEQFFTVADVSRWDHMAECANITCLMHHKVV